MVLPGSSMYFNNCYIVKLDMTNFEIQSAVYGQTTSFKNIIFRTYKMPVPVYKYLRNPFLPPTEELYELV